MTELTSLEAAETFINTHWFSFIFVSRTNCSVCHALLPQVEDMLEEFPNIHLGHVNADNVEEVAGRFSIFTVPALLFFVDEKEMIREARFVHMELLREKIHKIYDLIDADPE